MENFIRVKWRTCAVLFTVSGINLFVSHVTGNKSCTNNIDIPSNTEYNTSIGHPLALRCPVHFCHGEAPNVTWCKFEGYICQTIDTDSRISFEWTELTQLYGIYLLHFISVNENDNSYYQCSVNHQNPKSEGKMLKVNILSRPHDDNSSGDRGNVSKSWMTYVFIGLRFLLVIVTYSLLFVYIRRLKENHRVQQKTAVKNRVRYITAQKSSHKKRPAKVCVGAVPHRNIEDDPPTESFEMICEDSASCDDECTSSHSMQEQHCV
ncbi:B- and T-lymphocyte attenuator [Pelobates cultripes]|uniref:B- and T-lymphocyte attenuator n=1 Tax=Pelobates cultripes TaxID=61616 RepID=A0AAD1QXE6_PELCU|nr:B- and T-lymphocyte attenuator [Pelobates cultripes]